MQKEQGGFSFRATYRVLLLKIHEPIQPHETVLAICLDQNLVGRSKSIEMALANLPRTLAHSIISD